MTPFNEQARTRSEAIPPTALLDIAPRPSAILGVVRIGVADRKRVQEALRRRSDFDSLIARLSSRFVACAPEAIDGRITEALGEVGRFVGADGAFVLRVSADSTTLTCSNEWAAAKPLGLQERLGDLCVPSPALTHTPAEGHLLPMLTFANLASTTAQRPLFGDDENDPASFMIPLFTDSTLVGAVGFASFQRELAWPEETVTRLRQLGEVCANALLRRRMDQTAQRVHAALQQEFAETTIQLQAAWKELESFSYAVSHDLRAPLRRIDGFSRALEEDLTEHLGEKERETFRCIYKATQQAAHIIAGLLSFGKVTSTPMELESVDLSEMVHRVWEQLRGTNEKRQVRIEIEPAMRIRADARLLRTAIEHLLRNAWKFTSRHATARIDVSMEESDGTKVIVVRDDGAGFDTAQASTLFQPFQRLHGPQEFEGAGLGLATVRRIVKRHGGRIWAEGVVEGGATFRMTLSQAS